MANGRGDGADASLALSAGRLSETGILIKLFSRLAESRFRQPDPAVLRERKIRGEGGDLSLNLSLSPSLAGVVGPVTKSLSETLAPNSRSRQPR